MDNKSIDTTGTSSIVTIARRMIPIIIISTILPICILFIVFFWLEWVREPEIIFE